MTDSKRKPKVTAAQQPRKSPLERLADRVYVLLGYIFLSLGVLMALAWWGSEFLDYTLGTLAVYLLGGGLVLLRLQDLYEARSSFMTRQQGLQVIQGYAAQLWTAFWVFSLFVITAVGVYLVFDMAVGRRPDLVAAAFTLIGLAAVRLVFYTLIAADRVPEGRLRLPGWAQALVAVGLLVLLWLVVYAVVGVLGLPY